MTEQEFRALFRKAQNQAFDFAKSFVSNDLEEKFKFDISLNESADVPRVEDFDYYPEDDNKRFKNLTEEEIVKLLFRNKKIPVWIDINVKTVRGGYTIMNLLCAGRFSGDENEYYYKKRETGPFGIKSPIFPIGLKKDSKFKV